MIRGFKVGGEWWTVRIVPPSSPSLIDRQGKRTVATTDSATRRISVSSALTGDKLRRVLIHEAAHAAMESTGIARRIRSSVIPWRRVEVEETICNLIAEYGTSIIAVANDILNAISKP